MAGGLLRSDTIERVHVEGAVGIVRVPVDRTTEIDEVRPVAGRSAALIGVDRVDVPAPDNAVEHRRAEPRRRTEEVLAFPEREVVAEAGHEAVRPVDIRRTLLQRTEARVEVIVMCDGPSPLEVAQELKARREALFKA